MDILERLRAIVSEFEPYPDPYRYREMSCRGASDEAIGREEGRDEGREEVVDRIIDLIRDMENEMETNCG